MVPLTSITSSPNTPASNVPTSSCGSPVHRAPACNTFGDALRQRVGNRTHSPTNEVLCAESKLSEALALLGRHHFCIISGQPDIGKTTLAEMLIVYYISQGYEVVRVNSNIREALSLYPPARPTVYYYDDFLGQTTLETGKNEDQSIARVYGDCF